MMRTVRAIIALAVFASCIGLYGCGKADKDGKKVIATVSNRSITIADFRSRIDRLPAYYQKIIKNNLKRYLDETIMEMLLYEEALRKRLDKDKEVKEIISEARKKILISKLVSSEVDDKAKVSEKEIRKYYDEHKDEFKKPEMWRASHILVADEAQAKSIADELSKGGDFAELAKKYSIDATALRGGDIGFFRTAQLVPEFEKACLKLNVGQTGDILHTQFGYHIIKLTDKREAAAESYEEAKRAIESELSRKKRAVLFDEMVNKLKSRYSVNINKDTFEFFETGEKAKEKIIK
ncbi:MAG: peptidyl-prolyl cis-trans isomerase [Candidatus Omnitrophica bacterium]|nr:peptidyl-prolyl cis-trans isomerase [Candidatus Omnitrophota bacterium]